jgi:membrane-associated phospholipid phosphatase
MGGAMSSDLIELLASPFLLLTLFIALLGALALGWRWFDRDALWIWADARRQQLAGLRIVRWMGVRLPGLWAFIGRRLSPSSYLGLHLTLGLLLSLAALGLFGIIARQVVGAAALVHFDEALAAALHRDATPLGILVFKTITLLGSSLVLTALGLVVGLALLLRGQRLLPASWLIALAGGGVLNLALKTFFQRPRPEFALPFAVAPGWSFPSGHAMGSLITYGMLAYVVILLLPRRRARIVVIPVITVLVLLIGFSRLYLGVHYFSDVIAGYAAGTVWLSACTSGLEVARRRRLVQCSRSVRTIKSAQ